MKYEYKLQNSRTQRRVNRQDFSQISFLEEMKPKVEPEHSDMIKSGNSAGVGAKVQSDQFKIDFALE